MRSDHLKTLIQFVIPKQALTVFAGSVANIKISFIKNYLIRRFINKYHVNMLEAKNEAPEHYASFNDFFIRHLKSECRPIANTDIISPVDGCISEIGNITAGSLLQAKGRHYSVHELLGCNKELSDKFNAGRFATLYLSPKDYHRVHMPIDAHLLEMTYIPGRLFSVQPSTARVIPHLFARNERLVVLFNTKIGLMAMVLVGATIVGRIGTTWQGDLNRSHKPLHFDYSSKKDGASVLKKAAEMGYFKLGSTVVLLFSEGVQMQWQADLAAGDSIQFGNALGSLC